MLSKEDYLMIHARVRRGAFLKDVAAELGVHPKTVSRALKRAEASRGKRPGARKSILAPYKAQVAEAALEDALICRFGPRPLVDIDLLLRSDNGLIFMTKSYR